MYISKAIKITMDKASKVAKDTFKNPVKMELLKKKLSKTVNTQDFKTLKIILETGSAVGGVIMVFEYYYNPPAQASQVEELQKKLEEKIEEVFKQYPDAFCVFNKIALWGFYFAFILIYGYLFGKSTLLI